MTCDNPEHTHSHETCRADIADDEAAARLERAIEMLAEAGADRDRLRLLPKQSADEKGLAHFELGDGALDAEDVRYYEFTPEEAIEAVRQGHPGFAVYYGMERYGTEDVLAIDVDDRSNFPYGELPNTAMFESGSGRGDHLIYRNDGTVANAAIDDPYEGEVRAERLYTVLPGSTHDSGGMYDIKEDRPVATLSEADLPDALTPNSDWSTEESETIELDPDPEVADAEFTNSEGKSLEWARERDEKLDDVLTHLDPPGYGHDDTSRFDYWACYHLFYWRFDRRTIARIMRRYRNREKLRRRDDYLSRTVSRAESQQDEQYDPDGDPTGPAAVSMLPLARLDRLSHDERRRYARKRGIEWPTVDAVRDRLRDGIHEAMAEGERQVQSAPTGSGKTHTVATEPWLGRPEVTDEKPVIHAHRTHEARDQAREMSDEAGVDAYTLRGRKELCPVAAGDYDPGENGGGGGLTVDGVPISEWIDHKCDRQGLPFSHAHSWASSEVEGDLPCEEGSTECPAIGQFDGIPRNESGEATHDVIHCTHQFLHVPSLRMHTHVAVDEKPAFGIDLTPTEVRESVNAYLDWADAPVDSYAELVVAAETGKDPHAPESGTYKAIPVREHNESFRERMDEALNGENTWAECPECRGEGVIDDGRDEHADITAYPDHGGARASNTCPECDGHGEVLEQRGQPPLEWYRNDHRAHALAPAFTKAIWTAEESAGDRKHARVSYKPPRWGNEQHDEDGWNRVRVDVVLNDQWEVVEAESIPDFSLAESVIGLDAHPQPEDPIWTANVHPDMTTDYTLTTDERTLYRRYERGLFTVQVGEGTQPVTTGEWLDSGQGQKFTAIIKHLRGHYGDDFDAAITSMSARSFIEESMREAGIEDPEMMHFGAEESRNDFAGKVAGLVAGSIDPGDNMILNLCARLGLDVDACYKPCPTCDGTGTEMDEDGGGSWCDTCDGTGEVRERGRTFEGDDAELADAVLQGVREHHVAQSAGRWARDAEDPEDHATVYIATEAAPTGFIDARAPGVTWTANDDQRERLEYVRDNPEGATAKAVSEATGCSKKAAWRTLSRAEEEGLLERTPGAGPYGADLYSPSDAFLPDGAVDLGPDDAATVTDRVMDTYTYTVAVDTLPDCAANAPEGGGGDWLHQTTFEMLARGGPPPG